MVETEVRDILRAAPDEWQEWSVQGMGMLRRYLEVEEPVPGQTRRIHVWDSRLQVPDVSLMHTHPWDMQSQVFFGYLRNERYEYVDIEPDAYAGDARWYYRQDLRPGEGGGLLSKPVKVRLRLAKVDDVYAGGPAYTQTKNEIHVSRPDDGCVTIVDRIVPEGSDPDHAYTFWPYENGEDGWVDAFPRPASQAEVIFITTQALGAP